MMITYLELLRKEEKKTQPKKVFYNNSEYHWDKTFHGYFRKGKEYEPWESYSLLGDVARMYDPIEQVTEKIIEIID